VINVVNMHKSEATSIRGLRLSVQIEITTIDIERLTENELVEVVQKQLKNYPLEKVRRKLIEKGNRKCDH